MKFRGSRLALRRGIASLDAAIVFAEDLRANRFHDQDAVFVVRDPDGAIVAPMPAPSVSTSGSDAPPDVAPPVEEPAPVVAEAPLLRRPTSDVPVVLSLVERLDHLRRLTARATQAGARFDRALAAAEGVIQRAAPELPMVLLPHHVRLRALGAETRLAAEAFARSASVIQKQLDVAHAELA